MLVGVIHKPTMAALAQAVADVDAELYDVLELRLDGCADLDLEALAGLYLPLPAIFTLRSAREGGAYRGTEEERLDTLEQLAALAPVYLDVEAFVPPERIRRIMSVTPDTRIILSKHNFEHTPDDLDAVLEEMRGQAEGVIYKFAAMAAGTPDALRMLLLCKRARANGLSMIGISMGEYGESTRILAPIYHYGFSYCPVEESTAPGQIDAATLRDVYLYNQLGPDTAVYGLLGDPVSQSIGHVFHNRENALAGQRAAYVKWRTDKKDVAETLKYLEELGVKGLSVTMPLKEAILPCLGGQDDAATTIGAINTLRLEPGQGYVGTNTDGSGALAGLPPLKGKSVALLGAGGAARAVVWEVIRQGGAVAVFNRTAGKRLPGNVLTRSLEDIMSPGAAREYDVIINTLPFDCDIDYSRLTLSERTLAYDISYAKGSAFLEEAASRGCPVLDGAGMFEAQALLQRVFWGLAPEPRT